MSTFFVRLKRMIRVWRVWWDNSYRVHNFVYIAMLPSTGKCVMIVEDNELNKKLFRDLLEANGFKTVHTADGMQVLDMARIHRPDLILMDIQLPEVSGLEITGWLKKDPELKKIPIIAITAFAMKGDEEKILAGGCEGYLSKPISVSSFLATVRRYTNVDAPA